MEDLSLHILDIVENSLRAKATEVSIRLTEEPDAKRLRLAIRDNGDGMDSQTLAIATDPFFSSKPGKRHGLGLALLKQSAMQTGGTFQVQSEPGAGTTVIAEFNMAHPDMLPFGDMTSTLGTLISANSGIRFVFEYTNGLDRTYYDSDKGVDNG